MLYTPRHGIHHVHGHGQGLGHVVAEDMGEITYFMLLTLDTVVLMFMVIVMVKIMGMWCQST